MDLIGKTALRRALMTTAVCGLVALSVPAVARDGASPDGGAEPANGQSGSSADASVPASGGNEDIVVTARRSAENQQSVPIAITTVTAQSLTDLSVRDVIEIQRVSPGLVISSQGSAGRTKITIRGQSEANSRLTTDPSVGVYVDGVNWARDYGMRSALFDIAQIEVLRGPQGTLFGRNTTGGALNITTQHPTYDLGGYVDFLLGSYSNAQAVAAINLPIVEDHVALRLVGQSITRGGYGRTGDGRHINDDNVWAGRIHLRLDPTSRLSMLLSADIVKQRNVGPNVILTDDSMLQNANSATAALGAIAKHLGLNPSSPADRLTAYNAWRKYYDAYRNGTVFQNGFGTRPPGPNPLRDDVDHWGLSANVSYDFGGATLRSITAFRHLTKSTVQDLDATPFDLFISNANTTPQRNFSQELQLSSIDGHGLDWQTGVFYNKETGYEDSIPNNNILVNANRAGATSVDVENRSKAAYAQFVYNFADNLRATGGIRYTHDFRGMDSHNRLEPAFAVPPAVTVAGRCNLLAPALGGPVYPNCSYDVSTTSHRVTWLAGMDWRPVPELMLYGSVSTGYRAGGFSDSAASGVQNSVAQLNASFTPYQPEDVRNYELGFKSDLLDRKLRINGAFYLQDYTNIQKQVRDFTNGVLVALIRNAASATIYGGELEVTARPVRALTLTGTAAYLHARYNEFLARDSAGNVLDLSAQPFAAPKWTYNLSAAYELPLRDGSVRLYGNWAWTDTVNFQPDAPDAASVTQRGYGLLDGRITWNIASLGLDVSIFGKNLTGKRYIIAASNAQSLGWNIAFPGDPRRLGVELRKTF